MARFENFGGNLQFDPSELLCPRDEEELQAMVKSCARIRVMGSRHSWSPAIVTEHSLLSLERMNRVLEINVDAMTVRAQAGTQLKVLLARLEARGLTLANMGSIADQTIAGAISTGTHGTGRKWRCLADQVLAVSLIDGQGKRHDVRREDPNFDAVIVGLGCAGIIYEMTLSVVPCFQLHTVTETMRFDELQERFDELVEGHDHFKFWWLVPDERVIVFRQRRTEEPADEREWLRWLKDDLLSVQVYRACLALEKLDRRRITPIVNRVLGSVVGRRYERTGKSLHGFLTPVPPVHRESEWAFDYEHRGQLLRDYRAMMEASPHTYSFIQEIRVTAADPFWMSPAYQRDSLWLTQYNIDSTANWDDQLERFDAFAKERQARPHWGKEAHFEREYLRARYPRFDDFRELCRRLDPEACFQNRWTSKLLDLN